MNIDLEGVRKHLWRLAYPEKLYFVGELTGMTAFSPKMVRSTYFDNISCVSDHNLGSFGLFSRG